MASLREMREGRGVDMAHLASTLGISPQDYAACEAQPDRLTIGQAKVLCRVLQCDLDSLMSREGRYTNITGVKAS